MTIEPVLAFHRFGLGAKPEQLRETRSDMRSLLKTELRSDSAVLEAPNLLSTSKSLNAFNRFKTDKMQRAAKATTKSQMDEGRGAARSPRTTIYLAEIGARLDRALSVETGILERFTWFWSNHFCVSALKDPVQVMAGSFEREAIRPHVTGRFSDMLRAVMSHPAMLFYLDNNQSFGPTSKQGKQRGKGLNENLARELLELHTVGVDGGYSQKDITETAKILTGWSFRGKQARLEPFAFAFLSGRHEPGQKSVMGHDYQGLGKADGDALLDELAVHPSTAGHIARKLARHFVADDPPTDLVDDLEKAFVDSGGDLLRIYDALLDHPKSWSPSSSKLRTPLEWFIAATRAFEADVPPKFANRSLTVMGQRLWSPPSPAGFEDRAEAWLAGAMIRSRLDWATAFVDRFAPSFEPLALADDILGECLTDETITAMRRAATRKQAFQLALLAPEMLRR